jgi:hypothetical protein
MGTCPEPEDPLTFLRRVLEGDVRGSFTYTVPTAGGIIEVRSLTPDEVRAALRLCPKP